jgi:hypothetical protein
LLCAEIYSFINNLFRNIEWTAECPTEKITSELNETDDQENPNIKMITFCETNPIIFHDPGEHLGIGDAAQHAHVFVEPVPVHAAKGNMPDC